MIKHEKSRFYGQLMSLFLDYKFKQRFSGVNYVYDPNLTFDKSILVIGNHISWWDGFISWQLSRFVFKKDFYLMMLESELRKFWFFKKVGCFSIDPGSRSVVESLAYAADLLKNENNMVQFYPQGKLHSMHDDIFIFHKGLSTILKKSPHCQLVMYAVFADYSSNEKPYLNIFIAKVENTLGLQTQEIQEIYQLFYESSKSKHIEFFKK